VRFDSVYLAGVGSRLPERVSTERAVAEGWYDGDDRRRSGMQAVAVGEIAAPDLAVAAAETALRRAGHDGDQFGAVLHSATYHQGPDGWSAPHYILRRTLNRPIGALEIRQGCVGMLAGLELAAHRLLAEPQTDAVLITAADNFSVPLVDRWRASRLFLLADGGAAAVVSRHAGFARLLCVESVSNPELEELHRCGEPLFPPGVTLGRPLDFEARTAAWREASTRASAPPIGHLGDMVAETVKRALERAQLSWEDVTRVSHTGYARGALDAIVLDPLDLDEERGTFEIARHIGHVGAADPVIGLEALWVSEEVGAGDHVLLLAAGPGVQVACAAVEICTSYRRNDEGRR
jgi:3-oxoacyl-[acyl-carrier-protein] synthase-3